jgi:hypothetical protein
MHFIEGLAHHRIMRQPSGTAADQSSSSVISSQVRCVLGDASRDRRRPGRVNRPVEPPEVGVGGRSLPLGPLRSSRDRIRGAVR